MPYRDPPTRALLPVVRDVGAWWLAAAIAVFALPSWATLFALARMWSDNALEAASVAAGACVFASGPFAAGLFCAAHGRDAARAHLATIWSGAFALLVALVGVAAAERTQVAAQAVVMVLAVVAVALVFSIPAFALDAWQRRHDGALVAGRAAGLELLATIGGICAGAALLLSLCDGFPIVAGHGVTLVVPLVIGVVARRARSSFETRFAAFVDAVRAGLHPGFVVARPQGDYREWLFERGAPLLRVSGCARDVRRSRTRAVQVSFFA